MATSAFGGKADIARCEETALATRNFQKNSKCGCRWHNTRTGFPPAGPGVILQRGGLLILLELRASHVGQRLGGRYEVAMAFAGTEAVTSARKGAVRCSGAARHVPAFSKGKPHDRNISILMVGTG